MHPLQKPEKYINIHTILLFHTKLLLVVTVVYPTCIKNLTSGCDLTHLVTFSAPSSCFIICWNRYSKFTTWLNVKWSRKRAKGVSNFTGLLGEWNIGMNDAFKRCYQLHKESLVPLSCSRELMTCWQAHLTGQINTDNLFADSTMLSQHGSTPEKWFPRTKELTLLLKWNACKTPSALSCLVSENPQRLVTPGVGSTEWSFLYKMAPCDVCITWMRHWWEGWRELR